MSKRRMVCFVGQQGCGSRRRRCRPHYHRRHHRCPKRLCCPHHEQGNVKHRLLASIAREELALGCLIQAEAKKTEKLACNIGGPFAPDEVIAFQHSVATVLERAVRKEELLIKKLRLVMALRDSTDFDGGSPEGKDE